MTFWIFQPGRYAVRLFVILVSLLWWMPQIAVTQTPAPPSNTGAVQGTVFVADQDGGRSFIPGAKVSLTGALFSQQTISDESGRYRFAEVPPDTYQLEVVSPALHGSSRVQSVAGKVLDIPVELSAEAVHESVTVTSSVASDLMEPSDQSVLDRATVLNAPNKEERIDALLPLVPGVVRGPDGLINMKGARASQSGYLVNSANATDPVTGNVALSLPIDVVDSVKVIADPYDPEYGRLTGAVASVGADHDVVGDDGPVLDDRGGMNRGHACPRWRRV